jgi:hypothetical protein
LKASAPISFTASVGTVATTGAAGVGRSDSQTITRAGYNPVYASWDVQAAANAVTVNWSASGSDTLLNPTLRVTGYTSATAPTSVSFNGVPLVADVDVLMSVDTTNSTLWLTLLRSVTGASNTLTLSSPATTPCTLDIDGDGQTFATTDGLMLVRVMLGLTGTSISDLAVPAAPRNTWLLIRTYLNDACGMNLP